MKPAYFKNSHLKSDSITFFHVVFELLPLQIVRQVVNITPLVGTALDPLGGVGHHSGSTRVVVPSVVSHRTTSSAPVGRSPPV